MMQFFLGVAESAKDIGKPSEKGVLLICVGLISALAFTIALILYIKKTRFIYKIKAASCGSHNYDCGYEELRG